MIPTIVTFSLTAACAAILTLCPEPAYSLQNSAADVIRREALLPNQSDAGRPLPLAAHWNTGTQHQNSFNPAYQMKMIEQGHLLLPWFNMPSLEMKADDGHWIQYYEASIKKAAELKLPITLVGTQWEALFYGDSKYMNLEPQKNPNVVDKNGQAKAQVSPFGPLDPWKEVGQRWTASPMMKKLQEWYPDPPLVIFVSTNEAAKLPWKNAEDDFRFRKLYPDGGDEFFFMKVVGDGWIERYRALQQGMKDGLEKPAWKGNAVFIGYDAFGPRHFARWWGWWEFGSPAPGRIDPAPLAWDGGSPSYYIYNWQGGTKEYTLMGAEIEALNWVFMLKQAYQLNPKFWFELSAWDGHEPEGDADKRKEFARAGQTWTPDRYRGMVQWGMWLTRPRTVREFRGYTDTLLDSEAYFQAIVDAVDRVYQNPTLQEFWRKGQLVPNRTRKHYYQAGVFGYDNEDRWFLLNTNLDPTPESWGFFTEFPVLSLALVQGEAPGRRWLVYAHSPLMNRKGVSVEIPGYGNISVDATVGGAFFWVDEMSRNVQPISFPQRAGSLVFTQAASYGPALSPESLAIAWGPGLKSVDRMTLTVSSRAGTEQEKNVPCPILFAGDTQVNFVLPKLDLPPSQGGLIKAYRGNELVASGWISLSSSRPGIFTANASGQGVAAAYVIHRDERNQDTTDSVSMTGPAGFTAKPIVKKQKSLYLVLYGTGGTLSPWTYGLPERPAVCQAGGGKKILIDNQEVPFLYYGPAPGFPGVEQINVDLTNHFDRLPHGREIPVQVFLQDCFGANIYSNSATIRLGN